MEVWTPDGYWTDIPVQIRFDQTLDCNQPAQLRVSVDYHDGTDCEETIEIQPVSGLVLGDFDFASGEEGWWGTGLWHRIDGDRDEARWYFGFDETCDYYTGSSVSGFLVSPAIDGLENGGTVTIRYRQQIDGAREEFDWTELQFSDDDGLNYVDIGGLTDNDGDWYVFGPVDLPASASGEGLLRIAFSADEWGNQRHGVEISHVFVRGYSSICPSTNVPPLPKPKLAEDCSGGPPFFGNIAPRGGPDGSVTFHDAQFTLSLSLGYWEATDAELIVADVTPYESINTSVSPWLAVVGDGTGGKPDRVLKYTDAQSILAASLGLLAYEETDAETIALAGQDRLAERRIAAAHDLFTKALCVDPENERAAFLRSITRILGPIDEGWPGPSPEEVDSWWELMDAAGVSRFKRAMLDGQTVGVLIPEELPETTPNADVMSGFLADVLRNQIRASLDDLYRFEDPIFELLIESASFGAKVRCDLPREADSTDVHSLRACLHTLDAVLSIVVAQDYDAVDFKSYQPSLSQYRWQEDLIDPHPNLFMIAPGGLTDLSEADSALRDAYDQAVAALDALDLETDDQSDDLITEYELFRQPGDETRIRDRLERWRAALDGPSYLDSGETWRLNLVPFFNGQVEIRDILPSYMSFFTGGGYENFPDANSAVPADVTLGGMLPDQTEEDWLEIWGKYDNWLGGAPDGFAIELSWTYYFWIASGIIDGPGADLRLHVPDTVNPYSVEVFWTDESGQWQEVTLATGLIGSVDLDMAGSGAPYAYGGWVSPDSGSFFIDAIEALH
jgi:hypothetical protein